MASHKKPGLAKHMGVGGVGEANYNPPTTGLPVGQWRVRQFEDRKFGSTYQVFRGGPATPPTLIPLCGIRPFRTHPKKGFKKMLFGPLLGRPLGAKREPTSNPSPSQDAPGDGKKPTGSKSYNPTGLRRQPGYDWDPKTYNPTGLRPKKLQPDGATMADGPKIDPGGLQRAHQVEHIRD